MLSGLNLAAQENDTTKMFSAPGYMFRNSLIIMKESTYYKDKVISLEKIVQDLTLKNSLLNEFNKNLYSQNNILKSQLEISNGLYKEKEDEIEILKKEHKDKLFKSKVVFGGIGIALGAILTLFIVF